MLIQITSIWISVKKSVKKESERIMKISTPEKQGISSRSLLRFIDRLEEQKIPVHSILIARHGYLVLEAYYKPYERHTLHRMFSQTKSYTSLAIGLLVSEGRICLQDKICNYFPEYLPGKVHPWMTEMTIEDMLKMETCHNMTTYNKTSSTENWVRSFFQTVGLKSNVDYTVVNGNVVVKEGKLTGMDEEKITREANDLVTDYLNQP